MLCSRVTRKQRISILNMKLHRINLGILKDKTIDDELMYTPDYDKHNYYFWYLSCSLRQLSTIEAKKIKKNFPKVWLSMQFKA